jgi:hypothetical protein
MSSNSSSLPGGRVELITPLPARNPPRPARAWRIRSDIDLQARLPGLLRTSDWFGIAAIGFAATQVEVRIDPGISGIDYPPTGFSLIAGIPTLTVQRRALSGWGAPLKRAEDIVLTLVLLVVSAPVLLIIALLVKIDSRGPVLFRQERYGFNNNRIMIPA